MTASSRRSTRVWMPLVSDCPCRTKLNRNVRARGSATSARRCPLVVRPVRAAARAPGDVAAARQAWLQLLPLRRKAPGWANQY